jgi:arylsulfatase A-like enzyme
MDMLPTIASLTGTKLDPETTIDGMDVSSTLTSDQSPRDEFVYYSARGLLEGIRIGDWKYLEKKQVNRKKPELSKTNRFLFNLKSDLGEQNNLVDQQTEKADAMKARMVEIDQEVTANARPVWRKSVD